jgi:biopolymer transport protein ExbD
MDIATDVRKDGLVSSPNIVPLIDVLLVLIIIFMVITPRIPTGLPALTPQPSPPNARPDPRLPFAQVARAIDVMRGAGIEHVGLITPGIESATKGLIQPRR